MSEFKYNIARRDGEPESILIFSPGKPTLTGTPENPGFQDVLSLVSMVGTTYEMLQEKLSMAVALDAAFSKLSERVALRGGHVYFDGDRIDNALSQTIATFHVSGVSDYMPLVHFLDKVMQNPERHSREQLYGWMTKHHFGIAPDGDIVAYKGLNRRTRTDADDENARWESSNSGSAVVNGKPYTGRIPGFPGAVIEMPRSQVNHDPSIGCSTGLHVGNWNYASSFAQVCVRVKVNPRDVCSVPTDCAEQKMRVCRYTLLGPVDSQDTEILYVPEVYKTLCASSLDPEFERLLAEEKAIEEQAKAPVKRSGTRKAPAKKAPAKTIKKAPPAPTFYEDMKRTDLEKVPFNELRWVAKEWGIQVSPRPTKDVLVAAIAKKSISRRRQITATKGKRGAARVTGTKIKK